MVLLLTPLLIENEALLSALGGPFRKIKMEPAAVALGEKWAVATGGHGKVQFALTTQHLIRELKPRLVICAGACGALSTAVQLLDVIVATETIEHDYRLRFIQKPLPAYAGDGETLARLKASRFEFGLHFGAIASGDEDVIDDVRASEIKAQTQALAVAWEGAGGARACRFQHVPFLEARAVTDTANAHAPRDFTKNVKLGMERLVQVIKPLLD